MHPEIEELATPEEPAEDAQRKSFVPGGVYSFQDAEKVDEAAEQMKALRDKIWMFEDIATNILYSEELVDKAGALATLIDEFKAKIVEPETSDEEEAKTNIEALEVEASKVNSLTFTKQADGRTRWFGTWSNNFKDFDNPPDIITKSGHQKFIKMLEDGAVPFPELWLFHEESTKFGETDMVSFIPLSQNSEVVFVIASGLVDKGKENISDSLAEDEDVLGMSHGMKNVVRTTDADGNQLITDFVTYEFSVLPLGYAANKLTDFYT